MQIDQLKNKKNARKKFPTIAFIPSSSKMAHKNYSSSTEIPDFVSKLAC